VCIVAHQREIITQQDQLIQAHLFDHQDALGDANAKALLEDSR